MWGHIGFDYDFSAPLDEHAESLLPRIAPSFFVPPLEDKPQNPIMDSLKLEKMNEMKPKRRFQPYQLPQELAILTLDNDFTSKEEETWTRIEELWNNAVIRKLGVRVRNL
jgi:hypothetical protein